MTIVLINVFFLADSFAADWVKLQDNKHATLMLDKQSISTSGKFQKSWVKVDYKALQQSLEYPEKQYNRAKMLWYYNCQEQKSATAQVYQLLDDEQVYSAALDIKRARFMEPVPETEIDIAMQYVCKHQLAKEAKMAKQAKAIAKAEAAPEPKAKDKQKEEPVKKDEKAAADKDENTGEKDKKVTETEVEKPSKESHKEDKKSEKNQEETAVEWGYKDKKGPQSWGELSPEFALCQSGHNQSPINIEQVIAATPKPLKVFKRFQVNEFHNNNGVLEADFKRGNMVVIDKVMYHMKAVQFHAPSEHSIDGKSFPMEAQFLLKEAKGKLAVLAVMFEEGPDNPALSKLWKQMPKSSGKKRKIKSKVSPDELLPRSKAYYRFSGSLTTPPCTEGVIWLVMKDAMTISKKQITKLSKTIKHDNNRPLQPLNGRIVIEQ